MIDREQWQSVNVREPAPYSREQLSDILGRFGRAVLEDAADDWMTSGYGTGHSVYRWLHARAREYSPDTDERVD